jgi:NADH:ubiquinone oxidoreductase subunit 4 (subunit M)
VWSSFDLRKTTEIFKNKIHCKPNSWYRIFLVKLIVTQPVMKFPCHDGTPLFTKFSHEESPLSVSIILAGVLLKFGDPTD